MSCPLRPPSPLQLRVHSTAVSFGYLFIVQIGAAECFDIGGEGVQSLGTSLGLSEGAVEQFFAARSDEMLGCYRTFNLVWDNLYAVLYGVMYVAWISLLFKPLASRAQLLNLVPLLQVVFDWLENLQLVRLTNAWLGGNSLSSSDVQLASIFSIAKWASSIVVFVIIIIGIVIRMRRFVIASRSDQATP